MRCLLMHIRLKKDLKREIDNFSKLLLASFVSMGCVVRRFYLQPSKEHASPLQELHITCFLGFV